jgi:hypothetical protein
MIKNPLIIIVLLLGCHSLVAQTQIGNSIPGLSINDGAGKSVALSANGLILAVGSNGTPELGQYKGVVRVFQYVTNNWIQVGNDIIGEANGDVFGSSISLSADGNILAVGAYANDGGGYESGHVQIFQNLNNVWTKIGNDIDGPGTLIYSGISVSLSSDGTVVAIGANNEASNGIGGVGKVRVYQNNNGSWIQKGSEMSGEFNGDSFGTSLSLSSDGNTVAIGAPGPGSVSIGNKSGKTYVFEFFNGNWTQIGNGISGESIGDFSGRSVSISANGSIVAIGAYGNNSANGIDAGQVRVYKNIANTWTLLGNEINGESTGFRLGYDVSLSANGEILTAGTPYGADNAGRVKIFKNIANVWTQVGNNIDGVNLGDYASDALTISSDGTTVAIGSTNHGNYFGQTRVFDLSQILSISNSNPVQFIIYPNPIKNNFSIESKIPIEKLTLYTLLGQKIRTFDNSETTFNITELRAGNYLLEIQTLQGKTTLLVFKE